LKIKHHEPYRELRRAAYPPLGDQLDAVYKLAKHLQEKGESLPAEVCDWVEQCRLVKEKFPSN